jgi:hypothetical protein
VASGGSTGALLVSPFNVKWECYAWAGGVKESKFCLFSVVFPVMCFSHVSPRFYFRKHTFSLLTLAAILKSPTNGSFSLSFLFLGGLGEERGYWAIELRAS